MNVGIQDFSGPAQFIRANGLFGFLLFFSWPISLCLGFDGWSTSHPHKVPWLHLHQVQRDVFHEGRPDSYTRAGVKPAASFSDFFLLAVCLNLGVAWSPGCLWASLRITLGPSLLEPLPASSATGLSYRRPGLSASLFPLLIWAIVGKPLRLQPLSVMVSFLVKGQGTAIHKSGLCPLPVCQRARGTLVRMQILCQQVCGGDEVLVCVGC